MKQCLEACDSITNVMPLLMFNQKRDEKIKVKWGKEVYPDVELDTSESPMVFKAQVFALTGVQPHRQKIMIKGSTIKPDAWEGIKEV
ncbi:Ubiquitin carboxyl-terminal hydrolase 14 [Armadillidium vulgare]|nr:Ubiquitin carboxyl-terminal hydrolase 14 [Armadillidium vulgare]